MLLLGSKTTTIKGITIFADHADPNQFWYLPSPIKLAQREQDQQPLFTFIKYKPSVVSGGARGGGFLMFEVDLQLSSDTEREILSELSGSVPGQARLAAVPFDKGTVKCVALNLQGSAGTTTSPTVPGTINAVESILGASVPSLDARNSASFSLTLSQEGATILEKAFEQGTTPVGVIYNLKYTGILPALEVKITANLKRVYEYFSASLNAQYYFIKAGIEAGLEKLVQDGALKIEVTNFTDAKDREEKEKWAVDFFKDKLLNEWFEPTLKPTTSPTTEPPPGDNKPPLGDKAGDRAIAFKLKYIAQEEQKTVSLEYSRSEAVQRTYAPQGFIGLLITDLQDKEKHFVEVDLNDPFFQKIEVIVNAPIDFKQIGLKSAQVALDYGKPANPINYKHADFIFEAEQKTEQKFEVFMNSELDTTYAYTVQYHFDPGTAWEGRAFSYEIPPKRTEDRTLQINPFENFGFLNIQVFPNKIDWGIIDSVEVYLNYRSSDNWNKEKIITLIANSQPQFWKLRTDDLGTLSYTYNIIYHLKDGSTQKSTERNSQALAIPVNDLFEGVLEIEFLPLFSLNRVKTVFVDIKYEDLNYNYYREERLELTGGSTQPVSIQIAVMDRAKRAFQYRLTFIGIDNSMHRGSFITTDETLIGVSELTG